MASRQLVATKPLFSSDRERRLWVWTLAVVVAIYSTLGPLSMKVWREGGGEPSSDKQTPEVEADDPTN